MYTSVDGDGNPAGAGINPLQYKLPELRSGGDSPALTGLTGSRIPSDLPVGEDEAAELPTGPDWVYNYFMSPEPQL